MGFSLPHLDAQGNWTLAKQLTYVIAQSYDVLYPELKARQLIPVDNRVDPGANVVEWRAYSKVGKVKLIAPNATDLPLSDVQAEQNYGPVHTVAGACRYTLDEINAAVFKGNPLEQQKMNAVRESYEQELDRLAAVGDSDFKLQGLLTITGTQTISLPSGGGGGALEEPSGSTDTYRKKK
jgi:hypothetical protein